MLATEYKAASVSLLLEIGALSALTHENQIAALILFFVLHILASALIGFAIWLVIPKKYKNPKLLSYMLIALICFIVPLLSIIGFLVYAVILRRIKESIYLPVKKADFSEIILEKIVLNKRTYGESSLKVFAMKKDLATELRLKAFLLLTELKTPKSIELIKMGLKDPNDEIRLLSFSVINRLEKEINDKIHQELLLLQKCEDPKERALIHKELSRLYWEYIYIGLADEEYQKYIFEQIEQNALKALEKLPTDPYLYITMGKLSLRQKDTQSAMEYFQKAVKYGAAEYKTLPFLAEILYQRGEYARVRDIFIKNRYLKLDPFLYPIATLWEGDVNV